MPDLAYAGCLRDVFPFEPVEWNLYTSEAGDRLQISGHKSRLDPRLADVFRAMESSEKMFKLM